MISVSCSIGVESLNVDGETKIAVDESFSKQGMEKLAHEVKDHIDENFNSLTFSAGDGSGPLCKFGNSSMIEYSLLVESADGRTETETDSLANYFYDYIQSIL